MRHIAPALFVLPLLLSACSPPKAVTIENARISLPAVAGRPGAAYFTVKGGTADEQLMAVNSKEVIRTEIHKMNEKDGAMVMQKLDAGVRIPKGGTIAFAPGGLHVMLFDINPRVRPKSEVTLTFRFASGLSLDATAVATAPGDTGEHKH